MVKDLIWVEFATREQALEAIQKITEATGTETRKSIIEHAFEEKVALMFRREIFALIESDFPAATICKRDDAAIAGFNVNQFYNGPLFFAEEKFDEAHHLLILLRDTLGLQSVFLSEAMLWGYLGALYSIREAIKKAGKNHKGNTDDSSLADFATELVNYATTTNPPNFLSCVSIAYQNSKHAGARSILNAGGPMSALSKPRPFSHFGSPLAKANVRFGSRGTIAEGLSKKGRKINIPCVPEPSFEHRIWVEVANYDLCGDNLRGISMIDQLEKLLDLHDKWVKEAKDIVKPAKPI